MDDIINEDKSVADIEEKKYESTMYRITSNFGQLLVFYSLLVNLYTHDYRRATAKSNSVRVKAQTLQRKINELFRARERGRSATEEELLSSASMHFSVVTELGHTLSNSIYSVHRNGKNIEKVGTAIGMDKIIAPETGESIPSLFDEFKKYSDMVHFAFQSLRQELDNAQSTLRNTVEVIRTFLESKQRTASEESGRRINLLVIIFACFGLADALGNFVVYYLQTENRTFDDFITAMSYFFITMLPLVFVVILLYFGYFKRPRS
jgi:hypothetical protein